MASIYGLPSTPGYDNVYGVPSLGAVLPKMDALPPIVLPAVPPRAQGGGGNVVPMRPPATPAPLTMRGGAYDATIPSPLGMRGGTQDVTVPTVGRDIPLEKLIEIQRKAESTNNYQAINRERPGNTASGAYQYTDATWNNYGGYPKALLAPPEVQDRRFAEDIARRVAKYNGDLFKAIADHYLPAFADDPSKWRESQKIKVKGGTITVRPVETYLRHVLKGTPYIDQLDDYLNARQK